MPVIISILYPRAPGATFDIEYYLNTHMPLVSKTWTKHGMTSWNVCTLDTDSPYCVHAVTHWGSVKQFETAVALDSKEIMADVKNYTNAAPIRLMGDIIASS